MLRTYVEVHTARNDGRIAIVRKEFPSYKEAVIHILRMISEGFYYTTKNGLLFFDKPMHNANWGVNWGLDKAPVFYNDFGEHSVLCVRQHAEASQVKEGVFYL